ncbi:uncharacterized protein PV06_01631 [Exophiala oligosperma]|uniref:L-lactate dehydrogenase (cytochrome) n=1 Tax=Exophiala oligosperma TaxID=215243 RepID=A0A0D2B1B2_9EURO|nr:uncharacterized protein PV06_01631 [Exophiala oligosperma]KIW45926.1 hypothetical protein PV06_01631 [Exophiala oligosperma]
MAETKVVSFDELSAHNTPEDCWLVIGGEVWDVSKFAPAHPGGSYLIYKYAANDATEAFSEVHASTVLRENLPVDCFIGALERSSIPKEWNSQQQQQGQRKSVSESTAEEKPPLHSILNSYDFDASAAVFASKKAYTFYSTADTDCWTRHANEAMLKRIWFRPRVMRNVESIDTSGSMLGIPMALPLFICPTGLAKLISPEAENGLARAAKSTGILEIISTSASYPIQEIASQAPGYPFFLQLYVNKQRQKSVELLSKARSMGMRAIFVTVDAAGRGKRESDERLVVDEIIVSPVTGEQVKADKKGGGLTRSTGNYIDQSTTWDDIAWIRQHTDLPIVLKGIGSAEDARLAMAHNVDGILLSNHGGRNLDYSPPAILLLLEMHRCCPEIFDKMEVFVDGGFRRGADVLKALCLGAKAVGIGRTFLYALNYGTEGVEHLVEIIQSELESAMKLIGAKDLSEVHPGLVNTSDVDHLVPANTNHPYVRWRSTPKL